MSGVKKRDPVTGITKQPVGKAFVNGILFFGVLASMMLFFPYYSSSYLYIAPTIGTMGVVAFTWLNIQPNFWAKFLFYISLSSVCALNAIRMFNFLLPGLYGILGTVIVLTVIFSYMLPTLSLRTTRFLRGELSFAPKTQIGRLILRGSLLVLPVAGFVGAAIGLLSRESSNKLDITMLIMGPLNWFLAIILPFSTPHPISSWEYEKIKKSDGHEI